MTAPMPERLIDDNVRQGALGILEAAGEMDEWDVLPTVVLIAEGPDKPINIPIPVPPPMWLDKHPAAVLAGMSYGIFNGLMRIELGDPITPDDIRGAIIFTEGHDVRFDELTDAEKATFEDFKARHRLEEHPKSRELRMATMVDRSLTVALARHIRGEDVSDQIIYGIEGTMPDAISKLMSSLSSAWWFDREKRD